MPEYIHISSCFIHCCMWLNNLWTFKSLKLRDSVHSTEKIINMDCGKEKETQYWISLLLSDLEFFTSEFLSPPQTLVTGGKHYYLSRVGSDWWAHLCWASLRRQTIPLASEHCSCLFLLLAFTLIKSPLFIIELLSGEMERRPSSVGTWGSSCLGHNKR